MKTVFLGATPLTLNEVRLISEGKTKAKLHPSARAKIQKSRRYLLNEIAAQKTLYGVNTGFGLLSSVKIKDQEIEELQYNLIRSHAVGVGDCLNAPAVRVMLLLRAQALAQGYSGISLELVEHIIKVLNAGIIPLVPSQGSVGASGDLAPLAHLALVLIGEGQAYVNGKKVSGAAALKIASIKPIRLGAKEGLALINGTQFMAALGVIALLEAEHLCDVADYAGAMTVEATRGTEVAFESEIHEVRPHPGQIETAKRMRSILIPGGKKSGIAKSHENCGKVQDPYSLRCIPQVHGAVRDSLKFVREILEREINSVTDNPLVFTDAAGKKGKILSGGNFHGEYLAIATDLLAIAVSELASISEQRIEKLINPVISELPAFLVKNGGLNSGFMIVQVAAASIVSENKTLCHPASVDSIPTSADKEDHVSMGAWGAVKALRVVANSRKVIAMELLSAAQGVDLLRPLKSSAPIEALIKEIRKLAKMLVKDRVMSGEIQAIEQKIANFEWEGLVS